MLLEIIEKPKKRKYCILEYAPYGNIFDYIYCKKSGFKEIYCKVIFSKIMKGIQFCHKHNICHRDIKLQNILFDADFNPKICDFGFACFNAPNLKDDLGTPEYKPPEICSGKPYDGIKADIFCLGEALIKLVTGKEGFIEPIKDKKYKKIMKKNIAEFWTGFEYPLTGIKLKPEFKDLFIKMVHAKPKLRPSADEILDHAWFKEINDMSQEQLENIEREIRDDLISLVDEVQNLNQIQLENANRISEMSLFTRGCSYEINDTFKDFEPKVDYTPLNQINMNNYIKIKGGFNPIKFMNTFYTKLMKIYGYDYCYIEQKMNKAKFEITFTTDVEEENEEEKEAKNEEMEEEINNIEFEDDNNQINTSNNLVIEMKFYKCSDGHLIRFVQKEGNRTNFLDKFQELSDLIREIIS